VVDIQSVGLGRSGESHQVVPWREHHFSLLREGWEDSSSFQQRGVATGGSFVGPHNLCLQATVGVRAVIINGAVALAPRA